MFKFRKIAAIALTSVIAASTLMSASAQSTDKTLSSNFTLVNLINGTNTGQIAYIKPDGNNWRDAEQISMPSLGSQLIRRQYDDQALTGGSGSVVVSTDGPVGAVVQIQARAPQVPTFGAYIGVSEGASEVNVPLVMRRLNTASGLGNSQVIIQNAGNDTMNLEIEFIPGASGLASFTKSISGLATNAAVEVDLDNDPDISSALGEGWFGSAVVRSTSTGGKVAVVSNLFSGDHAMQTFNGFPTSNTKWGVPLFASKLANSLSTPVAVQNAGTSAIGENTVTMTCVKDPASPGNQTLTFKNATAIQPGGAYFFNPVTDSSMPELWFGACTVDSGSSPTAVFVQLRTVNGDRADAHEAIPLDSTAKQIVIPLYAKRLTSTGFATAVTILNLSTSGEAHVSLKYNQGDGADASCNVGAFDKTIPAGGSLIQNHRLATGVSGVPDNPNSVPQVPANCFGSLVVTSSDQPIAAFVQMDLLDDVAPGGAPGGDPFMAHNTFSVAASTAQ